MDNYGWLVFCIPLLAMLLPLAAQLTLVLAGFFVGFFNEEWGLRLIGWGNACNLSNNGGGDDGADFRATDDGDSQVADRQSIARGSGHTNLGGDDWWNQR